MAKKIILALFLILFGVLCLWIVLRDKVNQGSIVINDQKLSVEIADTPEKRAKGLGGRENLCPDCGMLFIFPEKGKSSFWMKDMRFPLDIIWIAGDRVVDVSRNVPSDYPDILKTDELVDKVLEINAGLSDEYGIRKKDRIEFVSTSR